ncbi:MAG: substrate-binding domain-containing protein [Phycisphaerae bacterium]|nr:substrate-binding domain-containing protein [Phycisphaerae bacterium]
MTDLPETTEASLKADLPLYERVREDLKRQIARMKVGDRLSPERKLAEVFQVDRITVRRAMMDLEKEGFVVRHQGRGTFIRRQVELDRRRMVGPKVIGLIMPDMEIPMHLAILRGVEQAASQRGFQCWVRNALLSAEREREMLEAIGQEELTGILTCPVYGNVYDRRYAAAINRLMEAGRRVVLIDQYVAGCDAPAAMVDKFRVGYLAAEHLIVSGHRRICYVSAHTYSTSGDESHRGYLQALADYGVACDQRLEVNVPVESSADPAREAVVRMLRETPNRFTAVATPTFSTAYGIYRALRELGLTVGRDIAMVGNNMGDNPELAHIPHTFQPYDEAARTAAELLFCDANVDRAQKHVLIPPRLVIPDKS